MNALQLYELKNIEAMDEEQKSRFKITDLSSLNWALRKLAAIEAHRKEIDKMVDDQIAELEHFRQNSHAKHGDSYTFFNSLIEEYAAKKREQDPGFRDVTPYGSVTYHKQQPKWNYDDEKLLKHLEDNELTDFIRVKKEPSKTDIKKQFKVADGKVYDITGQEVEGIVVEEQPDKLVVKVGG